MFFFEFACTCQRVCSSYSSWSLVSRAFILRRHGEMRPHGGGSSVTLHPRVAVPRTLECVLPGRTHPALLTRFQSARTELSGVSPFRALQDALNARAAHLSEDVFHVAGQQKSPHGECNQLLLITLGVIHKEEPGALWSHRG